MSEKNRLRMAFIFNCDYFDSNKPDDDYSAEHEQVIRHNMNAILCSVDDFLERGKLRIKVAEAPTTVIYRGWMLPVEQYALFYNALYEKGYTLINTPEQYRQCHYFPFWYGLLKDYTAESICVDSIDRQGIISALSSFGKTPLIIKDYVKSRKHEWHEACFIPDASDTENALNVIDRFIERQGSDLLGEIVLRKYLSLEMVGTHDKSHMPIAKEVRVFCVHHTLFANISYWTGDGTSIEFPDELMQTCQNLDSDFYTIDMAMTTEGKWVIIEVGDGQVSGLQDYDAGKFYDGLVGCLIIGI